jgi:hypothetical protein
MFWFSHNNKLLKHSLESFEDKKFRKFRVRRKIFRPKVKFVREQRIFAKGSRGPVKKKNNLLMRALDLYILSNPIQNTPPISTLLGLYGINVQKFCDELNLKFKEFFFDSIPLVVNIRILRDLNYTFTIKNIRLGFLLQSLDTRFILDRVNEANSLLTYGSFWRSSVQSFYDESVTEVDVRDFTFLDLWFLIVVIQNFDNFFINSSLIVCESYVKNVLSILSSYRNRYSFKNFKVVSRNEDEDKDNDEE